MQNQGYRLRAYIKSKLRTLQNLVIKMDLLDNINNIMILLLSHNSKRMDYLVFLRTFCKLIVWRQVFVLYELHS